MSKIYYPIKKNAPKLDALQNFIDFLSFEISPLDSIEKLAHLQGTSDLSIFFADLIERINEGQPDEAIQIMDDYARDFLEIFQELAKDEEWQRTILHELMGETPEPITTDTDVISLICWCTKCNKSTDCCSTVPGS